MRPDPLPTLSRVFGFAGFRGVQEEVVHRVLAGERTLGVMPTGAGKSLCYQLPSVMLEGTCVVVSPLIALMHDQLRAAEAVGIRAGTLTSADQNRGETIARFKAGELDLLYIAPERASTGHFRELLGSAKLSLFAIDEAHCVSEWGHDFRPDYRLLAPLMDAFPDVPRLALTATADAHTRADILAQLGIPQDGLIVSGFDRPNIRYAITPKANTTKQIADVIAGTPGPGIVYAQTRAATEKLAEALARTGRPTRAYHAGLEQHIRAKNQADFVASEDMVICATVAFGMGIDKPDVRFVAHAGLPKSIEAYYQETGRAGRDGDPAVAHLFWGAEDFARARQRIGEVEPERQAGERTRLAALGALVETAGCRRRILLKHFGEDLIEDCGNCDNCLGSPDAVDATTVAQKFLSAVFRTGQLFGAGYVEQVLLGQSTDRSIDRGHEALSVWGIVAGEEAALVKPVARALLLRDALRTNAHGGLEFGPGARPILKEGARVMLVLPPKRVRGKKRDAGVAIKPADNPLFEALRTCRRDLAKEAGVPPYVIFHDSVLREMAAQRPTSRSALMHLSGIGARKLEAYGDAFLEVIRAAD
ncbi:ATP-dependent DNA helicase RecQ [Sphingomonas melonis TY]|jgi:ATP-dependent DNA helicase RecQ|uniref:DNA helicase RecQ n=2 Tax=Sphingomonas TaxID=13687 RepID=A0A175Y440_9SPHN|nr:MULTISPECIES: DNA helicase RecQ [Sphingomonas]AOW22642.1 ATP-dependent DNA helicase RecQ [Sphingomonas melonis TY]ATI56039.1 DNA helicase RecQ [Sphingomonas melonis]KZB95437.1 ATP-dependent DNA helicase RecQ [Sphingomonas melonis TY]MBI0530662.1 DNA helicase RecQ [Sphingomonas sp. TX0522]MBX8845252.1 DNA helicase RecQ [Sphingomonas melonis]